MVAESSRNGLKIFNMARQLLFLYCVLNCRYISGDVAPDFHWTFDVNENNMTYEVSSVTHNLGRLTNGTTIVRSNERYGSVAYFNGEDSGVIIANATSNCFLNPGLCSNGSTFSFWINWEKWGSEPIISSPNVALKHMSENALITEIWDGQHSWSGFIFRNPPLNGVWFNYLFTWDKVSLKVFLDGVLVKQQDNTASARHNLLASSASIHPSQFAIGRFSSSSDASLSKVKMYFDDFKIWERPLSDMEAFQVYQSGVYNPKLFEVADISSEPQFNYILKDQLTARPSEAITTQHVNSLIACFKVCSKVSRCNVVGYKVNGMQNPCQLREGINFHEIQRKENEGFHYYSVD